MLVSFDFDSCLSEEEILPLVNCFIKAGCDVYIVTSRMVFDKNVDLFKLVDTLEIPPANVYFTNGAYKVETLNELGIDYHFDDMEDEVMQINQHQGKTQAFLFGLKDPNMLKYLFE